MKLKSCKSCLGRGQRTHHCNGHTHDFAQVEFLNVMFGGFFLQVDGSMVRT